MNEDFESESCVYLPLGNASISFRIKNEGSISEIFSYEFSEEYDWFSNQDGSVELEPGEEQVITFVGETNSSISNSSCQLIVVPSQRPSSGKTVINEIYINALAINSEPFRTFKGATLKMPFPNPFNSFINLNVENIFESGLSINIFDLNGRSVSSIPIASNTSSFHTIWNAESHPSGLYFLRISNSSNRQLKKILYIK
tara:strand:- start:84 stop:680 length:597 start_codon:yes stop_codon:yes gene_type:complete